MPIVSRLEDLGEAVIEAFGDYKRETAEALHEKLLDVTPVRTGTLRKNWVGSPGKTGSPTKHTPNTGRYWDRPKPFLTGKYTKDWSMFTIRNNSPYVMYVNDGIRGNQHNAGFIGTAIAQAALEMRAFTSSLK